jgi:hypothetical protein
MEEEEEDAEEEDGDEKEADDASGKDGGAPRPLFFDSLLPALILFMRSADISSLGGSASMA